MSERAHTKGPLTASGRFINAFGSVDTWDGPVHSTLIVCEPTEQSDGEGRIWTAGGTAEGNAARVVHTWNCHDDLVATLKAVRESFVAAGGMPLSDSDALDMIDAALAKASPAPTKGEASDV